MRSRGHRVAPVGPVPGPGSPALAARNTGRDAPLNTPHFPFNYLPVLPPAPAAAITVSYPPPAGLFSPGPRAAVLGCRRALSSVAGGCFPPVPVVGRMGRHYRLSTELTDPIGHINSTGDSDQLWFHFK